MLKPHWNVLKTLLVITNGVERRSEAGAVEPFEKHEQDQTQDREQVVEEHLPFVEIAGIDRQRNALTAADPVPVRDEFACGNRNPKRADGEVWPAQAKCYEPNDDGTDRTKTSSR